MGISKIKDKVNNLQAYDKNYYSLAREISYELDKNPGLRYFKKLAKGKNKILECGCGEGTKLNIIGDKKSDIYGVDYSYAAIKMGKINYPHINFQKANIEELSFKSNFFNFVYSAFVLEHTTNPEKIISEMIRVTKEGGYIGIICPNFGSFCYRSPCNKENIILRSLKILLKDSFIFILPKNKLLWEKVEPIANKNNYKSDWDTTIEPSLISTIHYLKKFSSTIKIIKKSSLWELYVSPKVKFGTSFIKFGTYISMILSKLNIYPFKYYGPQLFLIIRKK